MFVYLDQFLGIVYWFFFKFKSTWADPFNIINTCTYLTLCTFSFEINESRLSDTSCLIQDVVSPHCGDKRMARSCTRRSLPNYFVMTSYHWTVRENKVTWHRWMSGNYNVTTCTKCSLSWVLYTFWFNPCCLFQIWFYWNVR